MDCPTCKAEMRIVATTVDVSDDDRADAQTKVYQVQKLKCLNPRCPAPKEAEQRHLIYPTD